MLWGTISPDLKMHLIRCSEHCPDNIISQIKIFARRERNLHWKNREHKLPVIHNLLTIFLELSAEDVISCSSTVCWTACLNIFPNSQMLKMWKTLLKRGNKRKSFKLVLWENLLHSFYADIFAVFYTKRWYFVGLYITYSLYQLWLQI